MLVPVLFYHQSLVVFAQTLSKYIETPYSDGFLTKDIARIRKTGSIYLIPQFIFGILRSWKIDDKLSHKLVTQRLSQVL